MNNQAKPLTASQLATALVARCEMTTQAIRSLASAIETVAADSGCAVQDDIAKRLFDLADQVEAAEEATL